MAQMVKRTIYDAPEKDVVLNPDNLFEIGVLVDDAGVDANDEGRKIIPAGTPVGSSSNNVLEVRDTVLSVSNDYNAQGVLRHDVDVTDATSPVTATLVVRGEIDLSKCPEISSDAKEALTHLIFVNGGSY